MRTALLIATLALLAACGADGDPFVPAAPATPPGIAVTGSVTLGVNI